MHIEPGIVHGAKMALGLGTAATAATWTAKLALADLLRSNPLSFVARAAMATVGTFLCFEVLPSFVAGVSEVHFILGTTLFLLLGAAPAALGLALGLLIQGLFFAPTDLPMYFINVTTLLVPLFVMNAVARRMIGVGKAYVELTYAEVLKLSALYQGGVVAWVAFWVMYGEGFGAASLQGVATFATAYLVVLLIEPVVDLAVLAGAKALKGAEKSGLFTERLFKA